MLKRLRAEKEWKFFAVLPRANRPLAVAWWLIVVLRGVLPAVFAIAMGILVAAVEYGNSLAAALTFVGAIFILLQVLTPIHQAVGANLGDRTAAWLYDRLTDACVRPPGMGHLEDPELTSDLTVARDFDLGMTGPPLFISMDFIAGGLVEMIGGAGLGRGVGGLRLVGAPGARRGLAGDALPLARAPSGATATRNRSPQRPARRRLRLSAGRRSSCRERTAALRPGFVDDRSLRQPPHAALISCNTQATHSASGPCCGACFLVVGANVFVFWLHPPPRR